jgi:hypothetical protein
MMERIVLSYGGPKKSANFYETSKNDYDTKYIKDNYKEDQNTFTLECFYL